MLPTPTIIFLATALAGLATAEVPKQPPVGRYAKLWTDSFITTKPVVVAPVAGPGALDDWVLGGISKLSNGYLLKLFNRTDQSETRTIEPGNTSEFEVLEVRRDPINYLQTEVLLRYKGKEEGWVRYEPAMLALQAAPAQSPVHTDGRPRERTGRPPMPPGAAVPQPPQGGGNERRPRDRTMITPTPSRR